MSTIDQIRKQIVAHYETELFYLEPLLDGDPRIRELYVSKDIWETVNEPWPNNWLGQRHAEFRQTLDAFTRGDWLAVGEDPYRKGPEAVLARVDPIEDEIWDIRCLAPNARIRCLGAFGGKDLFIALTWLYREDFSVNGWAYEIARCKKEWSRLFGAIARYKGNSLDDYLCNHHPV